MVGTWTSGRKSNVLTTTPPNHNYVCQLFSTCAVQNGRRLIWEELHWGWSMLWLCYQFWCHTRTGPRESHCTFFVIASYKHTLSDLLCALSQSKKSKVYVDVYSVSMQTPLTRSDMDHTVLPANNTISAFPLSHRVSPPFGWYSLHLPTEGWPGWVDVYVCLNFSDTVGHSQDMSR